MKMPVVVSVCTPAFAALMPGPGLRNLECSAQQIGRSVFLQAFQKHVQAVVKLRAEQVQGVCQERFQVVNSRAKRTQEAWLQEALLARIDLPKSASRQCRD